MIQTQQPTSSPHSNRPRGGRPRWRQSAAFLTAAAVAAHLAGSLSPRTVHAQQSFYPTAGCVATIENRSSLVDGTGSYVLSNVPANPGQYRVRVICPQPDGTTLGANSPFYALAPNGTTQVPQLLVGPLAPQPARLKLQPLHGALSSIGSTVQLETQALLPDDSASDVTPSAAGTTYVSSNTAVATVSAEGVVTATGPGVVYITASNDGLSSTLMLSSFGLLDSDGDGMPDAYELANGLNPFDPGDANLDPDNDGLTNLQEYLLGTNPRVADTDGDGLNDGDEVKYGTNPLVADTDGDGLSDGDEIRLGTNPLNPDTDGDGIPDGIEVKLGLNPLVADATTAVTGHVTNPDGTPSAGAAVTLFTYFNATTDATGTYNFATIPVTLGSLTASARAVVAGTVYSGSSKPVPPNTSGPTDLGTIALGQTAGQVSGTVITPDNKPAPGVQVTVTSGLDVRSATTDSAGLYSVAGLSAGPVSVAAIDPTTSLRGSASGTLSPSAAPLTLNLKLAAYGTVAGTVRTAAGTPVGAGVTVTVAGALGATTTTDSLGHYSFPFVPLGGIILDATDSSNNHGRSTALVSATAQTLNVDIQYLAKGTITGTVSTATGTPVAGAVVMLHNQGQIAQDLTTTTNSLGVYTLTNVYAGPLNLSATSAATNTGGNATATLSTEGQTVTANISLQAIANVAGTVLRSDGTTPVPNATVLIENTAFTATADAAGKYTISNVPLGGYRINAADPAGADRGQAGLNVTPAGATVTADIRMSGLGTVNITVTDGGGTKPIPNATISVQSSAPLNTGQTAVSAADGTASVSNVLAGTVTVAARDPLTGLSGSATATLAAAGTVAIAVKLQPAGTIQGTVFHPDATTVVPGAYVVLDGNGQRVITDASGKYTLTVVPSGTHSVQVTDALGNVLATNNSVTVATQGQVVTANFVIIGRGTVTGHVTFPDGSAAAGIPIQIISAVPNASNAFGAQSDATGLFTVQNVPVGNYQVIAQQHTATTNAYGLAAGKLSSDGGTATTNVQLSTSLVPATLTLNDANGETYNIRETGGLLDGSYSLFAGDGGTHEGGSLLSLVQNGTETPFAGETFAPVDLNGRQISITQTGLDGLNVTRRVYVPLDGYFARYLELLSNPTAQDITVTLKLTSNYRNENRVTQTVDAKGNPFQSQQLDPPHILQTSSGDAILNIADPQTPDHWLTLGGPADDDPFVFYKASGGPVLKLGVPYTFYTTLPAVADVFDGPGARLTPSAAGYSPDPSGNFAAFTQTYTAVRIPAGGTVGLLHFVAQENHYAGANAAAARLAQLPPEALAGLSAADLGAIANFVIPAGGVSTLPALPGITASISGYVYASDTTTPVPGAGVSLQSSDPIFGRVYSAGTDGNGGFNFQGALNGPAIPAAAYTLSATHPLTGVISPATPGKFDPGATASAQSIIFSNTGILRGTVSRGPVVLNTAGTVTITGGSLSAPIRLPIAADGTYILTGVPPGAYTITAAVANTLLTGTTSATVAISQTVTADITIAASGSLTGIVTRPDGSLAVNDTVYLRVPSGTQVATLVDTAGRYSFTDLPPGSYTLNAYDAQSNAALTVTTLVTGSAVTTQNLALQSSGTVTGVVTANDGSSVAGLSVTLTSATSGSTQTLSAVTDSTGAYTVRNVHPGTLTARVVTPAGLQGTGTGSLPTAGQTVTVNVALTAAGNVTGTVFQADGHTPAAGINVTIYPAPLTGAATAVTDANGLYSFSNQPFGNFTVTANNPANSDHGSATSNIQANGQLRTVNITLIGYGNLLVKVIDANNNIFPGATVTVSDGNAGANYTATTDSTGTATFTHIAAGGVNITARDPVSGLSSYGSGNIPANGTANVTLTLQSIATIQGTVFNTDGTTPVAGARVQLNSPYGPSTTTAANGTYSFSAQGVGGSYSVIARDASGLLRAVAPAQTLQTNGQVLTVNLTFLPVGSVSGTVTYSDGSRGLNLSLYVVSQNPTIGGAQTVTTGGDGTYTVPELPVGPFTITVQGLPQSQAGYARGTIASAGDHPVVDIKIISSSITLPVTLTDADSFGYPIAYNGSFASTFSYDNTVPNVFGGAQALSVTVNGTTSSFGDNSAPLTSIQTLSGQGVEINQPALGGLSVTRKIYVPTNGYFSRRLDVLQNPTAAPITVNVHLAGAERYTPNYPQIVTTSNGNKTLDSTVRWVVDSDGITSRAYPRVEPALANVFEGAGATTALSALTQSTYSNSISRPGVGYVSYTNQTWNYTWAPVTIPPGGAAGFLFFTAQEATASTATTAAQRLVQLPAEALTGLSAADLASVVNFSIPASPLPAATPPATAGPITGNVYAGDAATVIPRAAVYEQSTDLLFGFGTSTTADAQGAFYIPSVLGPNFALEAVDPATNVYSSTTTGTATLGAATSQNISFINTGILQGLVKATGNGTFAGGSLYVGFPCVRDSQGNVLDNGDPNNCGSTGSTYDSTGVFRFLTLPAGGNRLQTNVTLPQGASIYLSTTVDIAARQTTQFTFNLPASGNIAGHVKNADGTPAAGVQVYTTPTSPNGTYSSAKTDAAGAYAFTSIALGNYQVTANDPITKGSITQTTTVTQDTTSTLDFTFIGKGTIIATVRYANGNVAANSQLTISTSTAPAFAYGGLTDANGQFTFTSIPTGTVKIRAYYPGQPFYSTTTTSLSSDGQTLNLPLTLTPVGTISGTLLNADGTPASGAFVNALDQLGIYGNYATTDSAGNYAISTVPADRLINVNSSLNNNTTGRTIVARASNVQIPGDGQTVTVNLRYPGLATVQVTVLKTDGTPVTAGTVYLKSSDGLQSYNATLNASGVASFANVVEANFIAYANIPYSSYNVGSTFFTVKPSDDGHTVQVTIHTTPTGTIQGQVFAADGVTPIRGNYSIAITDIDTGSTLYQSLSDSTFQFTSVQVGASGFKLTVSLSNTNVTASVTGNITTEGQVVTENITLPVSAISGTVFLNDGITPVPNIQVIASQTSSSGAITNLYAYTDANGAYQIAGLTAGPATLLAQDNNSVQGTRTLTLNSDTDILPNVNISLEATGTVTGTIYDPSGVPQPNLQVDISSSARNNGFDTYVTTDSSGSYAINDVPIGTITVSTSINNQSYTATGILAHNGDAVTIDIGTPLAQHGRVFGTIFDANGDPAPQATVTVTPADTSVTPLTATTDDNGLYSVFGVPVGDVTVTATLSGGTSAGSTTGHVADPQAPVEIDVGLTDTGNVSGTVVDSAGKPLAQYDTTLSSSGDSTVTYGEKTGDDGSFYYSGITPGQITFTVYDAQGKAIATATGTLPYGGNLTLSPHVPPAGQSKPGQPTAHVTTRSTTMPSATAAAPGPPELIGLLQHPTPQPGAFAGGAQ